MDIHDSRDEQLERPETLEWLESLEPEDRASMERALKTPLSDPRWVLAGSFTIGEDEDGNPTMEWVDA
jgi:hypothetical protein